MVQAVAAAFSFVVTAAEAVAAIVLVATVVVEGVEHILSIINKMKAGK